MRLICLIIFFARLNNYSRHIKMAEDSAKQNFEALACYWIQHVIESIIPSITDPRVRSNKDAFTKTIIKLYMHQVAQFNKNDGFNSYMGLIHSTFASYGLVIGHEPIIKFMRSIALSFTPHAHHEAMREVHIVPMLQRALSRVFYKFCDIISRHEYMDALVLETASKNTRLIIELKDHFVAICVNVRIEFQDLITGSDGMSGKLAQMTEQNRKYRQKIEILKERTKELEGENADLKHKLISAQKYIRATMAQKAPNPKPKRSTQMTAVPDTDLLVNLFAAPNNGGGSGGGAISSLDSQIRELEIGVGGVEHRSDFESDGDNAEDDGEEDGSDNADDDDDDSKSI
jgi:hypothetical protein